MTTTPEPRTEPCPECGQPVRLKTDGALRKHGAPVTCPGSGQPVGAARIPRRSTAGFYKDPTTGQLLRSVTTILNQGSPKESLIHWAGKLVAETAMDFLPALVRASRRPETHKSATDWLKRAHTRKRNERADIGTAVHNIIEAKVLGQPIPQNLLDDPQMAPYIEHFEAFVQDWQITFTASEMVVAHPGERYAGTLDYLLRSPLLAPVLGCPPDVDIPGDTKTGGEIDERTYDGNIRGVYPEAGVQMSAYRAAPYGWLRDGTREDLPPRHGVGVVLHLRPEGYRLYPVRCDDEVFAAFLAIRQVAEWQTGPAKNVVGAALTPPKPSARKVA